MKALLIVFLLAAVPALGDEAETACEGFLTKTKRKRAPVYEEPDAAARVLLVLGRGARVCYLGEKGDFAILQWPLSNVRPSKVLERRTKKDDPARKVAFVKRGFIWEPERPVRLDSPAGWGALAQRAWATIKYMMSGGVPDDPLYPYRPIIGAPDGGTGEESPKQ